jgi:hypothetical protein
MIRLNQNSENQVFVTFGELSIISNANYILKLKNNQTNTNKNLRLGNNLSPNQMRWDIFDIELVPLNEEDLENAKINLMDGTYNYEAYETSGTTGTSVVGLRMVESGLVTVQPISVEQPIIYSSDTIPNYIIYGEQ